MHAAARIRSEPRRDFTEAIRPLELAEPRACGTPNGEGIWLGNSRPRDLPAVRTRISTFSRWWAGIKRVLLFLPEGEPSPISDPTPFYGGIASTTSSYVRPASAPDLHRFPRFNDAARHSSVTQIEEGDLLCIPPCWWHHVEAAPGVNLMINAFVWSLPPRQEYEFETLVRKSIRVASGLVEEEYQASEAGCIRDRTTNRMPMRSCPERPACSRRNCPYFSDPRFQTIGVKLPDVIMTTIFSIERAPRFRLSGTPRALGSEGSRARAALSPVVQIHPRPAPDGVAVQAG